MWLRCLLFCLSAAAFAKSPITHETLWMMKRVSSPTVSPDGKWVVYTLTEPAYITSEQVADLWIVPADGSAKPRRLTSTKAAESGAAWSPDSTRIAFSTRRDGDETAQVYTLDIAHGGEAQRLTSLSTGASAPQFSPNGDAILFTSRVYPGAGDDAANKKIAADRKARKYNARVFDTFPVRHWDQWVDGLQTHIFTQSLDGSAPARDLLAGTRLVSEPGFGGVPASLSGGDEPQPVWSPDGKFIVFVAATNRANTAFEELATRLYRIPATGGEPEPITPPHANYQNPKFHPSGKALYALYEPHNGKIYNLSRLARITWPAAGAPTVITSRFDKSVGSFAFLASGNIFLTAEDAGLERIYETNPEGGEVRLAADTSSGVYGNLLSPEKAPKPFLISTWSSAVNPAEIVRLEPDSRRHRNLTEINVEKAQSIDWQPLRHFTFTSKRGRTIHNMLALPPGFDESKKYPLFVVIHGGPHSMWRDEITLRWNYHLIARPGYIVLLTNYTGSTGFGEAFGQNIQGDPLRGPGEELNEAADEAIRKFSFIDSSRQCAGGASYGGHLANWLQATTTRYRCLVSHAGLINLESQWGTSDSIYHREMSAGGPVWEQGKVWREQNPIRFAKNFRTPILLTVGENDYRVPLNQTLENWSVLKRLGIPSRLIVFPDANHWILKPEDSRFFYSELEAWLEKYLKG